MAWKRREDWLEWRKKYDREYRKRKRAEKASPPVELACGMCGKKFVRKNRLHTYCGMQCCIDAKVLRKQKAKPTHASLMREMRIRTPEGWREILRRIRDERVRCHAANIAWWDYIADKPGEEWNFFRAYLRSWHLSGDVRLRSLKKALIFIGYSEHAASMRTRKILNVGYALGSLNAYRKAKRDEAYRARMEAG